MMNFLKLQIRNIEERTESEDSGQDFAHSRHLRHACADSQCENISGAGVI